MTHYDLLIVGAGPAGSFAAELLAKNGARVALFDGRPEGEPKACGGGVTAKALKAWPQLLNAVGRTIHELDLYSPSSKKLHLELDEPFAISSRIAFDCYVRDRARDAGAHFVSEKISARKVQRADNGWRLTSNSGDAWQGSLLIGADGANSGIAKMLAGKLPPSDMEVAFGYRAPLPSSDEAPAVVAFLPGWVGYAWAFPRPEPSSSGNTTRRGGLDDAALEAALPAPPSVHHEHRVPKWCFDWNRWLSGTSGHRGQTQSLPLPLRRKESLAPECLQESAGAKCEIPGPCRQRNTSTFHRVTTPRLCIGQAMAPPRDPGNCRHRARFGTAASC